MSRFQLLSDGQWSLIEDLLPVRTGKKGRPFRDVRPMVEGIIYRYWCGIAWRDVPEVFGPWQTIWTWHKRMSVGGLLGHRVGTVAARRRRRWDHRLARGSEFTIARAHQHATNITRH